MHIYGHRWMTEGEKAMRTKIKVASCFAVAVALAALSPASGSDMDVRTIRARLAAQEAEMNDLEAKLRQNRYVDEVSGLLSIRKNAVVTLGGKLNTIYTYGRSKLWDDRQRRDITGATYGAPQGVYALREKYHYGWDLYISDAKLHIQIDVNDHFDAFLELDLHNTEGTDYYSMAESAYVRWKNIRNSGFGLKVGRDDLVFGSDNAVGELDSYVASNGDGMLRHSGLPNHNVWDISGVMQVTPYWEGLDGRLKIEASFMSNFNNETRGRVSGINRDLIYSRRHADGVTTYGTKNDGLGSMSGRVAYSPVDGLNLVASVVNYHVKARGTTWTSNRGLVKNNAAMSLAFDYRPCFLSRLYVWGQWIRGWNVFNYKQGGSDVVNLGASYDLTDSLTVFAQGDYFWRKYLNGQRTTVWAAYGGVIYSLGHGVTLEAGWKHEQRTDKDRGVRWGKVVGDTIYAMLGFKF